MYKTIRQEIYATFVKNLGWQKSSKFMDKSERNLFSVEGVPYTPYL